MFSKIRGFTLIELLIVISIIGVISLIAIASYRAISVNGRDSKRQTDLKALQSEMERYYADQGFYPAEIGMQTILNTGAAFTSPDGSKTYFNKVPQSFSSSDVYTYECTNLVNNECLNYCLYGKLENASNAPVNTNRYNQGLCTAASGPSGYNFAVSPP